jgi:hypothetical protein
MPAEARLPAEKGALAWTWLRDVGRGAGLAFTRVGEPKVGAVADRQPQRETPTDDRRRRQLRELAVRLRGHSRCGLCRRSRVAVGRKLSDPIRFRGPDGSGPEPG